MGFIAEDKWILEDALRLVRDIQPGTRKYQYHLCLGGGVLNNGQSKKDLDLYFLPMKPQEQVDTQGLVRWLNGLWGKASPFWDPSTRPEPRYYRNIDGQPVQIIPDDLLVDQPYKDLDHHLYAFKGKYMYGGLRIDVFVIGGDPLEGDMWYAGDGVEAPDLNPPQPAVGMIFDPPPLEGGEGDRQRDELERRNLLGDMNGIGGVAWGAAAVDAAQARVGINYEMINRAINMVRAPRAR